MKTFFLIPFFVLLLVSVSFAGQVISNDAVESKFLSDYQKVSTEKNSLELTTADYSDMSTNQVLVTQIDFSQGISIINFDIAGKTVRKISARPEASVIIEETIKCWHCEAGILNVYEAMKVDCLANNDILFFDEAEKFCQPEPQITCYICDITSWSLSKVWITNAECLSQPNQYLVYDDAYKACQSPDKPVLVDCYFCDGGYKLITSQECIDNGGHLTKEECEVKPIDCYQCLDLGINRIDAFDEMNCYQLAGFIDAQLAEDFCDKKPLQCFTCEKENDVKTSQECLDMKGLFNKDFLVC
jgi:hypothetical protein